MVRGKQGERGRVWVTEGRKGLSLPPAFLLVKNKNAGDHTRRAGYAHMSTKPMLIGS